MTESSDAGASMASKIGTLRLASDIDINDYIDLSGKPCRIPDVSRDLYQLTGISYKDDTVTLLHRSGAYTRDDIFLPENENLRTMMVDGFNNGNSVVVGIVTSLGQDAVYAVDVYQAGTAITFDPNDDLLNQSKTNDSSNVVLVRNVGF
ncbi:eukaryotic translation initiation factor 5A-3-like [Raphanus sativus]|nr:eukaryotic translation initiation factor 5A-3-like [Raphanus sativus]